MLNALFTKKIPFKTQISKRSTHTDLHHPPLHLAQFFSLESPKISSAYSKTSIGLKMEKFFQTKLQSFWTLIKSIHRSIHSAVQCTIKSQCRTPYTEPTVRSIILPTISCEPGTAKVYLKKMKKEEEKT